jgi:hypothetical protein
MENSFTPYEEFQLLRYGNIVKEDNNPLEAERFENGEVEQNINIQEWHNEQQF